MDVFDLYAKISLDTSGYESGLKDASNTTKSFGNKLGSGLKSAAKLATTAIAAVGTAAAAATGAMVAGAKDVAAYGDNIDKMSQKMGMSAEAYQEWDAVMQHAGTSMETMKAGMKTLANAVESGNEAFQRIGLTQEELANMSQEDIFAATIAGLQDVEDTTERTYLAGQLLGRGATELGALLNMTADETQAMRDRVHELGGVMSDDAVKASAQFQDNLQDMQTALSGIKRAITGDLLPGLNLLMEGFTSLLVGEEGGVEAFNEGFNSIVTTVGDATEKVFELAGQILPTIFDTLMEDLPEAFNFGMELVGNIVSGITEHTDEIIGAASKLIDVFTANVGNWIDVGSQLIVDVATGITNAIPQLFASVGKAIKEVINKFTDPKIAADLRRSALNMIKTLAKTIIQGAPEIIRQIPVIIRNVLTIFKESLPEVIDTALEIVEGLVTALPEIITSLLEALPEVLTMVVNTLVEALPVLINGIIRLVTMVSEHLPEIIQAIIDALPKVIQAIIGAFTTLIPAIVQGLVTLVIALVPHIPEIIKALIDAIPQVIAALLKGFLPFGEDLIDFFGEVFDSVGETVGSIVDAIKGFFEPLLNWFDETLSPIWDLFKTIWEGIKTDVSEHISELRKSIVDKFTAVKLFLDPIMTTIKNLIVNAWKWAKDHVIEPLEEFGAAIWEKFEEIRGWATDLVGDALEWGKAIVQNLTKGIKSIGIFSDVSSGGVRIGAAVDYSAQEIDVQSTGTSYQEMSAQNTAVLTQMVGILQEIKDGGMNVALEGDAADIFNVVNKQNRVRTKATGYNSLAMAGG